MQSARFLNLLVKRPRFRTADKGLFQADHRIDETVPRGTHHDLRRRELVAWILDPTREKNIFGVCVGTLHRSNNPPHIVRRGSGGRGPMVAVERRGPPSPPPPH